MSIPDPDKDLLDKLDRREARQKIRPAIIAVAAGAVAGGAAYEIMTVMTTLAAPAPLYGSLVVFVLAATWLFLRLNPDL